MALLVHLVMKDAFKEIAVKLPMGASSLKMLHVAIDEVGVFIWTNPLPSLHAWHGSILSYWQIAHMS
eukprot:6479819-Amphidinium_carterae.1